MAIQSKIFTTLVLLALNFSAANISIAQDASSFDIAEFNQIVDSINQSNISDDRKIQLIRDMQTTMIENVQLADIPVDTKRALIKDLESVTVE